MLQRGKGMARGFEGVLGLVGRGRKKRERRLL